MRRTLVIILLLAGVVTGPLPLPTVTSTAKAQGIDPAQELFVSAFLNFKKAEELENAGDLKGALKTFRMVADTLTRLKQSYPSWQPELVDFRLKRTMEAISRVQGKMGGGAVDAGESAPVPVTGVKGGLFPEDGALPPLPPPDVPLNSGNTAPPIPKTTGRTGKPPKPAAPAPNSDDPLSVIKQRIDTLEHELSEAQTNLEAERTRNAEMAKELTTANDSRKKAEAERKKAQDLAEMYQTQALEIKRSGDTSSERAKELEAQLKEAKKRNLDMEAELAAADLQVTQLISRSQKLANKAGEAGTLPAQIRQLETKLEAEQKAKAEATAKLTATTKERDDARTEIARLTDLNKQVDKLMTENTSLVKKLGEAEQLIAGFRTEGPNRDKEVAALRQQVTDGQKALTAAQQQNQQLQTEVGELQKRVGDYTKQIQQFKAEKTASAEDRRRMEEENRLLQGIVMRVLQEDANRAQRKKMVQKELDRLQVQSDVLLTQVSYLTQPVVKLSTAERRLFKKPVLDVQDPNTLIIIKNEDAAPANPSTPEGSAPAAPEATTPPAAPAPAAPTADVKPETAAPAPAPTAPAPATNTPPAAKPEDMAKLDKPPLPTAPVTTPGKDPTATPGIPTNPASAGNSPKGLPEDVRPVAEQAKQAFERENFAEAERLYAKALQMAPNNVYLLSNDGVVKFRAGKYRQAEESFRKALSIAPEDHFCWCTLGIVYYSQDKFDEAVNALTKSLAINPKNATAHNYLGITAAQKGWIEAALKELETAIQLDPKYADAWFNLAVTHTLRQPANKEEARKAYKKAVELGAEADPAMESSLK